MEQVKIDKLGINGEGVARENGRVLFIEGALPDEIVNYETIKDNKNYSICKMTKLITSSSFRRQPPCKYFDKCGGCQLQHLEYNKQLEFKRQLVGETFAKICRENVEVNFPIFANEFEYRNKAVFSYDSKSGLFGLKQEATHNVVEIDKCLIVEDIINKILNLFNGFINKQNINKFENIKYLVVRIVNKIALITIVVKEFIKEIKLFEEILIKNNIKYSLFININSQNKNILSNDTIFLGGQEYIKDEIQGISYFITPNSFMQVNSKVQDKLYSYLLDLIDSDEAIVNCYSGAGLLSALLAKSAKQVLGIEIEKTASKSADMLAKENNIKNLINICGDVKEVLPQLREKVAITDISIVLDPPRSGCDKRVIEVIKDIKPKNIYYISCNPKTLSRDYNILKDSYEIKLVQPFDMFPNTIHIETLIHLKRK